MKLLDIHFSTDSCPRPHVCHKYLPSSKSCSQRPSANVLALMWKTNFHTPTTRNAKLQFCECFHIWLSYRKPEDRRSWTKWQQTFPEERNFDCQCRSQIFKFCHIFKTFISYQQSKRSERTLRIHFFNDLLTHSPASYRENNRIYRLSVRTDWAAVTGELRILVVQNLQMLDTSEQSYNQRNKMKLPFYVPCRHKGQLQE
jgi:hypothetical protein